MAVGQVGFKDPKMVWRNSLVLPVACGNYRILHAIKVKKIHVPQRENPIVNRLNKTKVEKSPNLQQEKADRLKELRERDRAAQQARVRPLSPSLSPQMIGLTLFLLQQKEEARIARERKELAWQRDHAYDDLHSEDAVAMSSNQDRDANFEDDFM